MAIIIFLFGLAAGSFLNCVIYRLESNQSFLKGRSFCPHCKHQLGFWDLMPVLSFIMLGGKCRYCQKRIPLQYPLIELSTGLLFVFTKLEITTMGVIPSFYWLTIISFLIVIFVYDLKHYIIPDKVIYPAIGITLFYDFYLGVTKSRLILGDFVDQLLSAGGAAGFFAAIVIVSRGKWMGVGDIKLAFLMGLILGLPSILVALFLAFLSGAIIGVGLIVSGKKTMKSEVPFGPFLVTGTFIALFWGQELINWYVKSIYGY